MAYGSNAKAENTMNHTEAAAVCQRYVDALVASDLEGVLALFAEDATVEDPVGTPIKAGRDELAAFYQVACDSVVAGQLLGTPRFAGAEVAFPFEITITSNDSTMRMEIIDVFTFDESGKIRGMRAYWGPSNIR